MNFMYFLRKHTFFYGIMKFKFFKARYCVRFQFMFMISMQL